MSADVSVYREPPPEVVAILDAPPTPWVMLSPDTRWMLFVEHEAMPPLADVARPMLRLAGLRIDPMTNARHQTSFGIGLVLHERGGRDERRGAIEHPLLERRIELPPSRRISTVRWSHDSARFVVTLVGGEGTELWTADVEEARLRELASGLNAIFGDGFEWMPDGERLVCAFVPRGRAPAPIASALPSGPVVQETAGFTSPLRTYQDLLANAHDEALFEHYAQSELAIVSARDGSLRRIGEASLAIAFEPAPGDEHLLVTRVHRPFSYSLTVYGFPQRIEVWDLDGRVVHCVAQVPAAENIPIEGVRTGPRNVEWNAHEEATLVWAEALDGGDPRRKVSHRDRWVEQASPYTSPPREIVRLEHRASGLAWMRDPSQVLAREYDRDRRWTRMSVFDRTQPAAPPIVLDDRSLRDRYADPGAVLLEPTRRGFRIVRQEGEWIFRAGGGESPQGARPFLDRQSLATLATLRLWHSQQGEYENVLAVLRDSVSHAVHTGFITRHESPSDPPNLRLHSFTSDASIALTNFGDPTPQLRDFEKRLLNYERADGVALSGTLYLPPRRKEGERLPLVLWAYPHDFLDTDTAGQVHGNEHRFTRISGASHLFFLTQGYAVLDGASMPIIGEPETMNDTFIEQAVASARAAIDELDQLGICDRDRVGIGGHSYGAFMTATLLAHCDLFRAGIARSGAYNRTLTPFGFQAERRSLWEAKESYFKLSPFFFAEKIKAPLLLIHGADDNNPGTFPLQSERLFAAIKGNGGTARYVSLPFESHAYRARESILHVLYEMIEWFGKYVKPKRDS